MQFLLTNDDGIDSPGLQALFRAASALGDLAVVAPAGPQSGCSHQVTTHRPVRFELRQPNRFAVHGTPADCVRIGLDRLLPQTNWVLSGINHGGNLGADVYYSGTVAAVREAVLHGWPGIALSHFRLRDREYDWDRASRLAEEVLRELLSRTWEPGSFWNVNFPHLSPEQPDPEMLFCRVDPTPLPLSFRHEEDSFLYNGDYHARRREPGCDVEVCFGGNIAITQIRML
jgi:5'-nucleotidase